MSTKNGASHGSWWVISRLWAYYKSYPALLSLGLIGIISTSGATLAIGYVLRGLVGSSSSVDYLAGNIWYVVSVVLVLSVGSGARSFAVNHCNEKAILNIASDAYKNVLGMSLEFFRSPEQIINRFSADMTLAMTGLGNNLSFAVRSILILTGCIILIINSSWKMSLIALLTVPVLSSFLIIFGKSVRRASKENSNFISDFLEIIASTVNGITTVQAFCQERKAINLFTKQKIKVSKASAKYLGARGSLIASTMALTFASLVGISFAGAYYMRLGKISPGELTSFTFYSFLFGISLAGTADAVGDLQRAMSACARLMEFLHIKPTIVSPATGVTDIGGDIIINEVTFSYPGINHDILSSLSLIITEGESVSIVGFSGTGKSTLCSLLLRLYDVNQGQILIGGIPITDMELSSLRNVFGYVPSEPALFNCTLLENIVYGVDDYSMEDVHKVIEVAELTEVVKKNGLDYQVSARSMLSSGQKQRVAIARALLKRPKFLLFDEASSALDYNTDRAIRKNIDRFMPGTTKILVTHRLQTIGENDKVIVMEGGQVESVGTFAELSKNSKVFSMLLRGSNV